MLCLSATVELPSAVHEMIYSDARGEGSHISRLIGRKRMPELPEVETIANGLNKRVAGDRIDSVWVGSKPEPLKSSAAEISSTLEGAKVERVRRVGKHIVFDLSAGKTASGTAKSAARSDCGRPIFHLRLRGRRW